MHCTSILQRLKRLRLSLVCLEIAINQSGGINRLWHDGCLFFGEPLTVKPVEEVVLSHELRLRHVASEVVGQKLLRAHTCREALEIVIKDEPSRRVVPIMQGLLWSLFRLGRLSGMPLLMGRAANRMCADSFCLLPNRKGMLLSRLHR